MKRFTWWTAAALLAVLVLGGSLTGGTFGAEKKEPEEETEASISGEVLHTPRWDAHRADANRWYEARGQSERKRNKDTFWSGERFVLRAEVTGTEPAAVRVFIEGTDYETRLRKTGDFYEGELFHPNMLFQWGRQGPESLIFVFETEGGEEKLSSRCRIAVNDEEPYWVLHRKE